MHPKRRYCTFKVRLAARLDADCGIDLTNHLKAPIHDGLARALDQRRQPVWTDPLCPFYRQSIVTPLARRCRSPLFDEVRRPGDGAGKRSPEPEGIDRVQLEAVYRTEAPRLKRLLGRKIWIEDDRDDLVQEAFTRLASTKSGAASQNPGAYLHGIVRHLLADRVRRWARTQSIGRMLETALGPEALSPETAAEINQMRERYRAAVDTLPPRTHQVYMLHRAEELEYKVIAELLGISIRTVEWHMGQALIRISKSIDADG